MADDHPVGWTRLLDLVVPVERVSILAECERLLALPPAEREAGDKPHQGTRHLARLDERVPLVAEVVSRPVLLAAVQAILGGPAVRTQAGYRSPQPGHGGQRLHADAPPRLDPADAARPADVATAIIALVDFTDHNGATRVVPGSHRRPDLQRHSGSLARHDDEVLLTGRAGTAFVFTGHLLHSGTINRSDGERPCLQVLWARDTPNPAPNPAP